MTDEVERDTMPSATEAAGDDVRKIATIKHESVYSHWGKICSEVVLTDERIMHIKDGHEKDYVDFGNRIGDVIESPSFILDDKKNPSTALFIKRLEDVNINVAVRLKIEGTDADDLQSSVITMYRLGEKTLARLLKKNLVLYNSEQ